MSPTKENSSNNNSELSRSSASSAKLKGRRFVRSNDYSKARIGDSIVSIEEWERRSDYFSDKDEDENDKKAIEMRNLMAPDSAWKTNKGANADFMGFRRAPSDEEQELAPLEFIDISADTSEEAIRDKDTVNITCIWLHGLGADGSDLARIPEYLQLPEHISMRHLLPHAPKRAVTVNGGTEMRAWYDMRALPPRFNDSIEDIEQSAQQILKLLEEDTNSARYLVGFSQGGCIALYMALKYGEHFSGVVALSCYIPQKSLIDDLRPGYICPATFIGHGKNDSVIPYAELNNTARMIRPYCPDLVLRRYRSGHGIDSEAIRDINYWFLNRV